MVELGLAAVAGLVRPRDWLPSGPWALTGAGAVAGRIGLTGPDLVAILSAGFFCWAAASLALWTSASSFLGESLNGFRCMPKFGSDRWPSFSAASRSPRFSASRPVARSHLPSFL